MQWLSKFHIWVSAPWEQIRTSELKTVFNSHVIFTCRFHPLHHNDCQHHADHAHIHHHCHHLPHSSSFIPHASSSVIYRWFVMLHFSKSLNESRWNMMKVEFEIWKSNLGIPHDRSSPRADSRTWRNVGCLTRILLNVTSINYKIHQNTTYFNVLNDSKTLSPTPFLPVWPAVVLPAQPRAASLVARSLAVQVVLVPTLKICTKNVSSSKKKRQIYESPEIPDTSPLHPSFSRKMWGCQQSKWCRLVFNRQFNDSKIFQDFQSAFQAYPSLSDCLGNAQLHQILARCRWRNAVQQLTSVCCSLPSSILVAWMACRSSSFSLASRISPPAPLDQIFLKKITRQTPRLLNHVDENTKGRQKKNYVEARNSWKSDVSLIMKLFHRPNWLAGLQNAAMSIHCPLICTVHCDGRKQTSM